MNQRKAGVILSYVLLGTQTAVGLLYIPMLLMFLTQAQYGLYQLIGAMIGYLGTMDFGLANTVTRYYSHYLAKKKRAHQQNLLATAAILYGIISILIWLIGISGLYFLLPLYAETLSTVELIMAKYLFCILLINLSILIVGNIFTAVINSHEKFIFAKTVMLVNTILQPTAVFAILHIKNSVLSVAIVQTCCNLAIVLINYYYATHHLQIKFKLYSWNWKFIREILSFSFFIFLIILMDLIYVKTGQLIVGAFVGTAAVAVYSISVQMLMMFRNCSGALYSLFLPYFSAIHATKLDMQPVNLMFIKISRLQFLILSLILGGFILFGKQFIILWAGIDFAPAYIYTIILMFGFLWVSSQSAGSLVLQAQNKHMLYACICIITALANLVLSFFLTPKWGGLGCALSTTICLWVGQFIVADVYFYYIGLDVKTCLKNLFSLFIPVTILVWVWYYLLQSYISLQITVLLLQGFGFCLTFTGVVWLFCLNKYEKELLLTPFKKIILLLEQQK